MAAWQYTFFILPKSEIEHKYGEFPVSIDPQFMDTIAGWEGISIESINKIISRSFGTHRQSSYGPIIYGQDDQSCVKLLFKDSRLIDVTVRLDVRQAIVHQIEDSIRLCDEIRGAMMTPDGKIIYSHADLIASIKSSTAVRFAKDPIAFLESLSQQKREN